VHAVEIGCIEAAAAPHAEILLRLIDVPRLDVLVLVVRIDPAVVRVAAGLRDELGHHTRPRHLRRIRAGRHGDFFYCAVVVIETGGVGAFSIDNPLDHRPMLIRLRVVRRIAGLGPGSAAAHVDALHLDGRRGRQDRPEIARVRQRRQLLRVEVGRRLRGRDVDNRRLAAHGDRLRQRRNLQLDIDGRRKPEADAEPRTDDGFEPREFVFDRVVTRRDR
jgi:hypothetical protein